MGKQINTPDLVVRIEKSGVRFNAWDTDGNKRTSEITTGARKKAFEGDYLLGRFTNKAGKFYWKNGSIYAFTEESFRRLGHRYGDKCAPVIIPPDRSINIDSINDISKLENYYREKNEKNNNM